jgi:hypothetical protein
MEEARRVKSEAVAQQTNISLMKNELLDKEVDKINKMEQSSRTSYISEKVGSKEWSSEDLKEILRRQQTTKIIGVLKKTDDTDVKAAVIANQLSAVRDPEDRKTILTDLASGGIINADVLKRVLIYENASVMDIVSDLKNMKTQQQKQEYLSSLAKRGLIDKDTLAQVVTVIKYDNTY